jgi:putative toxin-antitoxin system antitoxin component (TIGR02293 family)
MRKVDSHNVKERVLETLGSEKKAIDWFKRPNRALGGRTPAQLVKRKKGRRLVLSILGRIEHGVYS